MLQSIESLASDNRRRRVWIVFLLLCVIGAAAAVRRVVALGTPLAGSSPFAGLDAHFVARARPTLLHIVPSLLFVLIVPLQFVSRLRQRYPDIHRWMGRMILSLGLLLGISALWLSRSPVGGAVEAMATIAYGSLFLFSLGRAWWHIRKRRVDLHREWVIRMVSIALGVATTRPIIAIFLATSRLTGLLPEQVFGPAMWLGFTATYSVGEAWIRRTRAHGISSHSANAGTSNLIASNDSTLSTRLLGGVGITE